MIIIENIITLLFKNPLMIIFWIIRIIIALVQLSKELMDLNRFNFRAAVDNTGFILIYIENKNNVPIQVKEMRLVLDKSRLFYALRRLIGINTFIQLRELSWKKHFKSPRDIAAKGSLEIYAQIDDKKYDLSNLAKFTSLRPMIRVEIAGHTVLKKLEFSKGNLRADKDNFNSIN